MGNDFCYLHTMLDGSLSTIGNGFSTIPLYVLATGADLTPEPSKLGFENEV